MLALGSVVLLAFPAAASALPQPTLFETTGGTGDSKVVAPPSNLYSVDPATGAATSVGNTGYAITGLAQDPTTGVLYAVSNTKSPIAPLTLLTLNPATGAATPVGPLGPGEHRIADITFDSLGRLYGWDEVDEDDLASIDKRTGTVTVLPNPIETLGGASSFDRDDTFWNFAGFEGEYQTIDVATGAATPRGTLIRLGDERSVSAAAWDCPRTTVYATLNNFGKPPASLVTIDTTTGALTNKGLTVTAADGLEWFCPLAFEFTKTSVKLAASGGRKALSVPVVRGPRIKGAATVAYATRKGSAKAGVDFKAASGTLTFPNNVGEQSLQLVVRSDPKAGKNRKFTLELSSPSSGGSVGQPVTVTIATAKPRLKVVGPSRTAADRPTFKLRSNQLPARFRCKLDGGKFEGCGKNGKKGKRFKAPRLDPGSHSLVVQAVNSAGRKSKPVKTKFVVLG